MTNETDNNTLYQSMIFNAISENINLYGIHGLEYVLKFKPEEAGKPSQDFSQNPITNVLLCVDKAIKEKGAEYFICFVQPNQNLLAKFVKSLNLPEETLNECIKKIIMEAFQVSEEDIMNKVNRDGVRVYAIGALNKFYFEVFGYDYEKIMALTNKSYSLISRNKTLVTNLNFRISFEREILNKYLLVKHQFINFILKHHAIKREC